MDKMSISYITHPEENECLKADMRNLEEQNWKLKEEKKKLKEQKKKLKEDLKMKEDISIALQRQADDEHIRFLDEQVKAYEYKEENKKLLADKETESKEMSRRLERLNHFEDYVLDRDYATEDFKEYLEAEGYKMTEDGEIVEIEDEVFTDDD